MRYVLTGLLGIFLMTVGLIIETETTQRATGKILSWVGQIIGVLAAAVIMYA